MANSSQITISRKVAIILVIANCGILYLLSGSNNHCVVINQISKSKHVNLENPNEPVIYGITPTYARAEQKAELTRLSQTLKLISNFHWIVIEDSNVKTPLVTKFLEESGLSVTHLYAKTPSDFVLGAKDEHWSKPRGVAQRNAALSWLRDNLSSRDRGVIYFMDDDNSYSVKLFDEMRKIRTVGVWPVGLVGGLKVEKPLVDLKTGKVTGFNSAWRPERPFPVDMAGFAINLQLFLNTPEAQFSFKVQGGYQESEILKHLTVIEDLQPLADKCTKVYVWHTRTEKPNLKRENELLKKGLQSDDGIEV